MPILTIKIDGKIVMTLEVSLEQMKSAEIYYDRVPSKGEVEMVVASVPPIEPLPRIVVKPPVRQVKKISSKPVKKESPKVKREYIRQLVKDYEPKPFERPKAVYSNKQWWETE